MFLIPNRKMARFEIKAALSETRFFYMEAAAVIVVLGFAAYVLARERKIINIQPRINRSNKLPREMSDREYLERVVAENNKKERTGKIQSENKERIKKDFL
ncbi:MAG: hypothetical protein WC249_03475 [Patescibacteria group bacterium]|jgi:hypothetical protein